MNTEESNKLIEAIRQLPDLEPPHELVHKIMRRLEVPKPGIFRALGSFLFTPRPLTLRPITICGACCLLFALLYFPFEEYPGPLPHEATPSSSTLQSVEDAKASFLIGRGLMEAGLENEALPLLQKASLSHPDNPQYAYWEGLCYWANGMVNEERRSYLRGLESAPTAVPLRLNLAHSYLEAKDYREALNRYGEVLSLEPDNSTALYNRALIFHLQEKQTLEKQAWLEFLHHYTLGSQAFRAVQYLNDLGDFTYRIYNLGKRRAILNQSALLGQGSTLQFVHNADILAQTLQHDPSLSINIIGFNQASEVVAKHNTYKLKKYITDKLGEDQKNRISLSWFGESEQIQTTAGSSQSDDSLLIFTSVNKQPNPETSI